VGKGLDILTDMVIKGFLRLFDIVNDAVEGVDVIKRLEIAEMKSHNCLETKLTIAPRNLLLTLLT
jgi:hypothetical protein